MPIFRPLRSLFPLLLLAMALVCMSGLNPAHAAKEPKPKEPAKAKPAPDTPPAVQYEDVVVKAKELAAKPFKDPRGEVPDFLMKIDFDAWRDIRFNKNRALFKADKLPFEVEFFHPGLYYDRTVAIHVVDEKKDEKLPFDTAFFNYGPKSADFAPKIPRSLGYAGWRVHSHINNQEYKDEFLVFLGASYFRAVPKGWNYGLSTRGLAVDTASPKGEEFPYFREFWLIKPKPGDASFTCYALLDSPSVTGAYRFVVTPGVETTADVKSTLILRKPVEKLGVAPLTSMFWYGENTSIRPADDFRPEIHDSDGLLINFAHGEWLWRPIQNGKGLMVYSLGAPTPKGFGLLQRDVDFRSYEDLEARYEKRPGIWIEPANQWGEGAVELVEIPTVREIDDNIVAYWMPKNPAAPGTPMQFDYKMTWFGGLLKKQVGGYVDATRTAKGKEGKTRKIVIDFKGGKLDTLPDNSAPTAIINVGQGAKLIESVVYKNTVEGGWRLAFHIAPDDQSLLGGVLPDNRPPVELRAFLQHGSDVVTETWSYAYKF